MRATFIVKADPTLGDAAIALHKIKKSVSPETFMSVTAAIDVCDLSALKTALDKVLCEQLRNIGKPVITIDGDDSREGA